ncbi:hypothetical protein TIFTF001_016413 [Ficus carica]|uniref:Uncharacterized protein n=1 Tax=Ficus carica TaxID=3494 RepID=A0AA88ANK5_FICCA|nr:hypothetical protein TIFTF001_016413 [Ficus carica]
MSHEALMSCHYLYIVGDPRNTHALEFAIELEKVGLPTTEIVHKTFEAAITATSSKIGEEPIVWDQDRACEPRVASDGDRNLCFSIEIGNRS